MRLWTNNVETYLAESRDQLRELYKKNTGLDIDKDEDARGDGDGWIELDANATVRAWTGEVPGQGDLVEATALGWIARGEVPGFLCSTEY